MADSCFGGIHRKIPTTKSQIFCLTKYSQSSRVLYLERKSSSPLGSCSVSRVWSPGNVYRISKHIVHYCYAKLQFICGVSVLFGRRQGEGIHRKFSEKGTICRNQPSQWLTFRGSGVCSLVYGCVMRANIRWEPKAAWICVHAPNEELTCTSICSDRALYADVFRAAPCPSFDSGVLYISL